MIKLALTVITVILTILPRQDNKVMHRLTGAKAGAGNGVTLNDNGRRLICINQSISQLYSIALCNGKVISNSKSLYKESVSDLVDKKYCFELMVLEGYKNRIYKIMETRLKNRFPKLTVSFFTIAGVEYLKIEKKEGAIITALN